MKISLDTNSDAEMLQRINNLHPSSKPLWGKMTVDEMICHVSDPIRDLLKIRETKPVTPKFLRPVMRWFLLNEKPFSKNAPTVKPYLQLAKGSGTRPIDFLTDIEGLKTLTSQFSALPDDFALGNHAALGNLTMPQARLYAWKHLDHHLRQFGV